MFPPLRIEPVRPAPARAQVALFHFEDDGELFELSLHFRRGGATQPADKGRHPAEVQGRERTQQMVTADRADVVAEGEIVDDARPELITELERFFGTGAHSAK